MHTFHKCSGFFYIKLTQYFENTFKHLKFIFFFIKCLNLHFCKYFGLIGKNGLNILKHIVFKNSFFTKCMFWKYLGF